MELSLLIPVYKGGKRWEACWKKVLQCHTDFDHIFVSFNFSEMQRSDIRVLTGAPPNVHYAVHTQEMSSVEHAAVMTQWIRKQNISGMLFILCHDDLLYSENIAGLRRTLADCDGSSAFYGPFAFLRETPETVREAVTIVPGGVWFDRAPFLVEMLKCPVLTVSSIILPAAIYAELGPVYEKMQSGWYSEILLLLNPYIKRIRQADGVLVDVLLHEQSEGAVLKSDPIRSRRMVTNDTFVTCLFALSSGDGFPASCAIARLAVWRLYRDPVHAVRTFFLLLRDRDFRKTVGVGTFAKLIFFAMIAAVKETGIRLSGKQTGGR